MTNRDEISKDVDDLLVGWFDGERHDVDKNDIVELVLKHSAQAAATPEAMKALHENDAVWARFYRDGKTLGEICEEFNCGIYDLSPWLTAPLARSALSAQVQDVAVPEGWQDIGTAPTEKGNCFFCQLAWGPENDRSIGDGFRWNGRWFAVGTFYKGGRFDECQYEKRQIEVQPTHWMPLPAAPAKQDDRILHKHTNIRSGD
ncbi:DUF551 domain-containing protein [Rhizobium pusense]|uniref:DUF551 domain-containing protein n=1 Tax=Agrobacterium pusense TaxID=648995 RepID=UPI002449769C|nr:DUF551 domain-containing protein [Agrobacterium pusense]MDH1266742.1 DUF551 domain-containing protein [Agrobacterium pusense]